MNFHNLLAGVHAFLKVALAAALLSGIQGCKHRNSSDPANPVNSVVNLSDPDSFLRFFNAHNTHNILAATDFKIVAATSHFGEVGNFTITVTFDDGSTQVFDDSWTNSGGQDETSPENPAFTITLKKPGGIRIDLESTVDTYLYLLDQVDDIIAEDDDGGAGFNSRIVLPSSRTETAAYAEAYYKAIDPNNDKDTLAKWKTKNGFDAGADAMTVFRDVRDIGYGRRSFWKFDGDGVGSVAVYVENYQVGIPDLPGLDYGTLNLEAAVNADPDFHFNTNAIEFSAGFAKFYTFVPDPGQPGTQKRALMTNFDGRGNKALPTVCASCHGAPVAPLQSGVFPNAGIIAARMLPVEVDQMEFDLQGGLTRADQEAALNKINGYILSTYPAKNMSADGEWTGDFARELIAGWYKVADGVSLPPAAIFDGNFVPVDWKEPANPLGAEELYLKVVGPHCAVCHAQQGTNLQSDVDFSTYEKFMGYADDIVEQVFEEGVMPLGLLNYNSFWADPQKPALLADFLNGVNGFVPIRDGAGNIMPPGLPVARAGEDRTTVSPARLDGSNSLFADSYQWTIMGSAGGGVAILVDSTTLQPMLMGDNDTYTIKLVASNGTGGSGQDTVKITLANPGDPAIPVAPADLTFDGHIKPLLQDQQCIGCHSAAPPVSFVDSPNLFNNVLARINLADPGKSLMLSKPAGEHHNGGSFSDFNIEPVVGNSRNLFLNWIIEGVRKK